VASPPMLESGLCGEDQDRQLERSVVSPGAAGVYRCLGASLAGDAANRLQQPGP
jgi:hypothetical protein